MKRIKGILSTLLSAIILVSCQIASAPEMDEKLQASQIDMQVVQETSIDPGGNTVIFRNNTPGTIPIWSYGTGRSTRQVDTVRYAFKGSYTIKRSAMTDAGIVELPDVTIEVLEDNLNYVNDPLWNLLTGGVGNEKTWLLDLDEDGVSKYFPGPIYFSGVDWGFGNQCSKENGDCWNWFPEYQSWMPGPGDYGSMTFNLKGGPFITVDQKIIDGGLQSGTFYLDKDAKTITFTDVIPLNMGWPQIYSKAYIISLTEESMQLAFKHTDKVEFEIYNYISKDYSDNWVPPTVTPTIDEGFNPTFAPGELLEMLTGGLGAGRQWSLDASGNPVDWVAKGKGWTTDKNSSWDWGWNSSWETASIDAWIMFDQFAGGKNYTRHQNGVTTAGTFSIDEAKNEITLTTNTLLLNPDSWMNPTTNTIKVVKGFPNDFLTKGVWFGTNYDDSKDEWLVFHYLVR